jgi:hypothetical protein
MSGGPQYQETVLTPQVTQWQDHALRKGGEPPYDGGDGGDGMMERVVRLEAKVEHVQTDVTELRTDMKDVRDRLKGLEVKVDHLPSKGFIVTALLASLALMTALISFQEKLQALLN